MSSQARPGASRPQEYRYLSSIAVKDGKVFALFVRSPARVRAAPLGAPLLEGRAELAALGAAALRPPPGRPSRPAPAVAGFVILPQPRKRPRKRPHPRAPRCTSTLTHDHPPAPLDSPPAQAFGRNEPALRHIVATFELI
jgi:hypothetical protein